jgi:hypothetical protein
VVFEVIQPDPQVGKHARSPRYALEGYVEGRLR